MANFGCFSSLASGEERVEVSESSGQRLYTVHKVMKGTSLELFIEQDLYDPR